MSEKVKVPKFLDEWLANGWDNDLDTVKGKLERIKAISELTINMSAYFGDPEEVVNWVRNYPILAVNAVVDVYEVYELNRGFKLSDENYVGLLINTTDTGIEAVDYAESSFLSGLFISDKFVSLDPFELEVVQTYLKGEVVTEDEN